MKKHLLFFVWIAFLIGIMPAKAGASSSASDTVSIPWREGFESITSQDMMPYGMSYQIDGAANTVRTYLQPYIFTGTVEATTQGNTSPITARSGNKFAAFVRYSTTVVSAMTNNWIFSRGLFLRAGNSYKFSFWYATSHANANGWMLEAAVGMSPAIESMNTKVGDSISVAPGTQYQKYEGAFIPEKDGIYYLGIHGRQVPKTKFVNANHWNAYLSIDDLEVDYGTTACNAVTPYARSITDNSAEIYWTYKPKEAANFIVNYKKTTENNWTEITVPSNKNAQTITGLTANTLYHFRLGAVCSGNTLWKPADTTFRTTTISSSLPNPANYPGKFPIDEKFDEMVNLGNNAFKGSSGVKWYLLNDSLTANIPNPNKWYIKTLTDFSERGNVAYISDDNGVSNKYNILKSNFVHMVTDSFYIPKAEEFYFSFDWRANGEISGINVTDYLKAYFVKPATTVKSSGLPSPMPSASETFATCTTSVAWKNTTLIFPDTLSGKVGKLVFTWVNNNSLGNQPPAAVDNIVFKGLNCGTPKDLTVTNYPNEQSLQLACTTYTGDVSFDLAYRETGNLNAPWLIQKGNATGNTDMNALLLKNLSASTEYEIKVQKRCGTDTSFWSESIKATTGIAQVSAISENFESGQVQGAKVVNGTQTNKWVVGSAVYQGSAGKSLYISNDGAKNQYDANGASIVHLYYDIHFSQAETFRLSFDWKGIGQSNDFMRVSLVDLDETPVAGEFVSVKGRLFDKDFYNRQTWAHEELVFSNEYAGKSKRLIFTWKNSQGTAGIQPPAAVDNLKFESFTCKLPELKIVGAVQSAVTLMMNSLENGENFVLKYRIAETEEWKQKTIQKNEIFNTYLYNLSGLQPASAYEIQIRRQCGADTSFFTPIISTRTTQEVASLTLKENFDNTESSSKWTIVNGGQKNKWTIGSATSNGGKSIYITTGNSDANIYDAQTPSVVHFYRDIHFSQAVEYDLYFDWKGGDENNFLSLQIADVNQMIEPGEMLAPHGILDGIRFYGSNGWKRDTVHIKADQLVNSNQTLVFTWQNGGTGGTQTPIAIDNIELSAVTCPYPKGLTWIDYPQNGAVEIKFTSDLNTNNYDVSCYNIQGEQTRITKVNNTNPTLTGLNTKTNYEIKIRTICPGNDTSFWSEGLQLLMPQEYAKPTFTENFESSTASNWSFVNGPSGSRGNKWFIGNGSYMPGIGNQGLYIDSETGITNICAPIASVVHAYRDIDFPVSNSDFILSFQWKSVGIVSTAEKWATNFVYARLIDIDKLPVYGVLDKTDTITPQLFTEYEQWNDITVRLAKEKYSGTKKRLVFTWNNVAGETYLKQPPATIDNVKITFPECNTPTNLTAKALSEDSIQLTWRCLKTDTNNFVINYNYNGGSIQTASTKDTSIVIKNLKSNTAYNITLLNECGGENNTPVTITVSTSQVLARSNGFTEDFGQAASISEWTFVNNGLNDWHAGNFNFVGETNAPSSAAFISNDNGTSNSYTGSSDKRVVHLYRDIQFGSQEEVVLQFKWRSVGGTLDFMKVYLADSNIVPVKNIEIDDKYNLPNTPVPYFGLKNTWQDAFITIKGKKNVKKRLIFSWKNNVMFPTNPPIAFSNVSMQAIDCSVPSNLSFVGYPTSTSVALKWDAVGTNYMLQYRQAGTNQKWDTSYANNKNKDTLINLFPDNVMYEVQVKNNCGQNSAWSPLIYFFTEQPLAVLPFDENFENANKAALWTRVNAKATNAWYIGEAATDDDDNKYSAYISNDEGKTYTYSTENPDSSIVHIYRDIDVPVGSKELLLSFDWKGFGERYYGAANNYWATDFMSISIVADSIFPKAGKAISGASAGYYLNKHDWAKGAIIYAPDNMTGGRKRIVFTWQNNGALGVQPPIAIDNIHAEVSKCVSPRNVAIYNKQLAQDTATLCWSNASESGVTFNIYYRERGEVSWNKANTTPITDTFCIIRGLFANTLYDVEVQAVCGGSNNSVRVPFAFRTLQEPVEVGAVFREGFENQDNRKAWTMVNDKVNKWFIGAPDPLRPNSHFAYISDSNGYTHHYEGSVKSYSHLYRDLVFPPAPEYLLTFDWQCFGEAKDYMIVSVMSNKEPVTTEIVIPQTANITDKLYGNYGGWAKGGTTITRDLSNSGVQRLIFTWANDSTTANQNPAAIDNIELKPLDCETPKDLKVVSYPDLHSVELSWKSSGDTFTVNYKKDTATLWNVKGVRGSNSVILTGLDSNTLYNVKVENNCPAGPEIIFCAPINFRTLNTSMEFNNVETFEDSTSVSKWVTLNDGAENQWHVGELDKAGKCMYISDDKGLNNTYNTKKSSIVHLYRDIYFPPTGSFELSFNWRARGELNKDDLQVGLFDLLDEINAGDLMSKKYNIGTYYNVTDWRTVKVALPDSLAGKKKRLVFTWRNDNNDAGMQPPAAVDDIRVDAYNCKSDSNLQAKSLSTDKIGLSWKEPANVNTTGHLVEWRLYNSFGNWKDTIVQGKECVIPNLSPRTFYEFRVSSLCEEGISRPIIDSAKTAYPTPFFEDFDVFLPTADWNRKNIKIVSNGTTTLPPTESNYTWLGGKTFVSAPEETYAAKVYTSGTRNDWLLTPHIDLGTSGNMQMEFKLGLIKMNTSQGFPDQNGDDDIFMVLISSEKTWSSNNALATWDNTGKNRDFNAINYTRKGDKIIIPLNDYTGSVRFAFYMQSTVANSSNELFIDSLHVRPFVCKDVTELKALNIDYDASTIKWKSADVNQNKWEVRYGTSDSPIGMTSSEVYDETQLKLTSLDTNQIYHVFARSICHDTIQSEWEGIEFATLSTCEKMNEDSISVKNISDISATISWEKGDYKSWELRYGLSSQTLEQMQKVVVTSPTYTIPGLTEQTTYAFYLQAVCQSNETSNWTSRHTFITTKTPCPVVSNIIVSNEQTSSVTISWNAVAAQAQWEIRYGSQGMAIGSMQSKFTTQKSTILDKLEANHAYDFYVRGICRVDDSSSWSDKTQFRTKPCEAVDGLNVVKNTDGNSATLSWNSKQGQDKWEVAIVEDGLDFSKATTKYATSNPYAISYSAWGIAKTKTYDIYVQGECGTVKAGWSTSVRLNSDSVGISTLLADAVNISLSPNPAKDFATLRIRGAEGKVAVQIYSVKGELLLAENLICSPEQTKEFVIRNLHTGAYTVRIVHEKWARTETLIVQ